MNKEEMMAKALRDYPVGTRYKSAMSHDKDSLVVERQDFYAWAEGIRAETGKGWICHKEVWAEIISKPVTNHELYLI